MNNITVCFACDNNYITHAGVCIVSMLENSNIDSFYEIFIINNAIDDINKNKLNSVKEKYSNFSLEFIEINNNIFKDVYFGWLSPSAYYGLLIPGL